MQWEIAVLIFLLLATLALLTAQNIYYSETIDKLKDKIEKLYELLGGK